MYMYISHGEFKGHAIIACKGGGSLGTRLCMQYQIHVHVDCLGCAVLLCLVCLIDLACFFLSSFSSLSIDKQVNGQG